MKTSKYCTTWNLLTIPNVALKCEGRAAASNQRNWPLRDTKLRDKHWWAKNTQYYSSNSSEAVIGWSRKKLARAFQGYKLGLYIWSPFLLRSSQEAWTVECIPIKYRMGLKENNIKSEIYEKPNYSEEVYHELIAANYEISAFSWLLQPDKPPKLSSLLKLSKTLLMIGKLALQINRLTEKSQKSPLFTSLNQFYRTKME